MEGACDGSYNEIIPNSEHMSSKDNLCENLLLALQCPWDRNAFECQRNVCVDAKWWWVEKKGNQKETSDGRCTFVTKWNVCDIINRNENAQQMYNSKRNRRVLLMNFKHRIHLYIWDQSIRKGILKSESELWDVLRNTSSLGCARISH